MLIISQWELAWEGVRDTSPRLLPVLIAELPPTDLAHTLIELFFANVNIHFPLLHRPTFERQFREGLQFHDAWFSCLCLSVFAVASRWCSDIRVLPNEDLSQTAGVMSKKRNWRQAGSKYFEACLREFRIPAKYYDIYLRYMSQLYSRFARAPRR